ncbi:MAG: c-type cytochrome [Pseudomonadales bacterium]|nr:c-type cytochrome [Pseudomonadales bacterium]
MELVQGQVQDQLQETDRWYSSEQVAMGASVFSQNCAECHGPNAEGTVEDWRQRLDDGSFPPPPLNGSAHAWHHPNAMLLQVINNGGEAYGGNMPPFDEVLEEEEKLAAIAFFQNFWTDEIYSQWEQMGGAN